jgi:hypothetical protein
LTVYDEAFIVAIVHNGFDRWVQESSIVANGGIVDKKNLPKNRWTDNGASAKKYEGWVEEGVVFFNEKIGDLQNIRLTATSKMLEDKYMKENKDLMEDKRKGAEKRSFQVSALNGLVARQEVVRKQDDYNNVPGLVLLNPNRSRSGGQLPNKRRKSRDGSDRSSSLSGSGGSYRSDDEDEEEETETEYSAQHLGV